MTSHEEPQELSIYCDRDCDPLAVMSMLSLLTILVVFGVSASQECPSDISSCSSCIQSSLRCVWCNNPNYTSSNCFERNSTDSILCGEDNIFDVKSNLTTLNVDSSEDDTMGSGDNSNTTISFNQTETLVKPDIVYFSARPNDVRKFNVTISIPENYPLDFYYLMDLSNSMGDDLQTIQDLSPSIINTLRNLTTNFQVGFGGYCDKESLPFTNERQNNTFDYIHYQSLTSNEQQFTTSIRGLTVTASIDEPESTFDALMQASVCTEIIGWRPTASHIILIATDASYHLAGDGKLGGALLPNDMKCHMSRSPDNDGSYNYDKSLELDYPSVGQIAYAMQQQRIVPIFAVINNDTFVRYEDLREQLPLTSYISSLTDGSRNILNLIEESYNSLSQSVSLSVPSVEGVNITVRPLCNPTDGMACTDVTRGETASFEVSVEVTDCNTFSGPQNITLEYPFLAVSVTIQLTALCRCGCETDQIVNSSMCSHQGDLVCGRCQCDRNRAFGRFCQCPLQDGVDPSIDQGDGFNCPSHNGMQCNNHGNCTCNECQCEEDYTGDACQTQCTCPDNCTGPSNGNCVCNRDTGRGECSCSVGYTGANCDCSTDTTNCYSNITVGNITERTPCSGRGTCECNMCDCNPGCSGPFCGRCRRDLIMCNTYRTCVQCELSERRSEVTRPRNCNNACPVQTVFITPLNTSQINNYQIRVEIQGEIQDFDTEYCSLSDGNNCFYTFYVGTDDDIQLLPLHIENSLRCTSSRDEGPNNLIWIIPVAIVAGLLILGLIILLIIKLFLLILDYVEVRQFERAVRDAEGKLAQTSQPLYQSPVVEYQNLAYGIEKKDNK